MSLVCVSIMVSDAHAALEDAAEARRRGADLVEWRLDEVFHGDGDEEGEALALKLCAESPLPCIATCRPTWEGGSYDGSDSARVSLFERLGTSAAPPRYIDVELAAYTRSANLRQKVNLAIEPRGRDRHSSLILSMHDFDGRPADLTRKLAATWGEDRASVVKVAFRARSLRDNLELFDILRDAPKPTIALGMGEFGLMSRVLAPKFGGFLTFAGLRDETVTAPGQPSLDDLLGMYRFRSIGRDTRVYGVIGWPVGHSMGPLIHNAAFEAVEWDGVYLPLPVVSGDDDEASYASFKATMEAFIEQHTVLRFCGASVTLPHKQNLVRFGRRQGTVGIEDVEAIGAANTVRLDWDSSFDGLHVLNSDALAIRALLDAAIRDSSATVIIRGAGGAARAAVHACMSMGANVLVVNRSEARAAELVASLQHDDPHAHGRIAILPQADFAETHADVYINCTPIGMAGGPDPEGLSVPVDEIKPAPETVFFDTVYNPIETPMLKAAKRRGCKTIDGVEMFVRQAAGQFELWTGKTAPSDLFDRLVRERLS